MNDRHILFEPWGLGDASIALAVALQRPRQFSLACQSKWHRVLAAGAAIQGLTCPDLLEADLSYVGRNKTDWFTRGDHDATSRNLRVLSIRGDLRDYRAAREMFPHARVVMRGWLAFAAKRSKVVDLPFASGVLAVRSRYEAWARLIGVPRTELHQFFAERGQVAVSPSIVLHAGAQWRSKQFPFVAELAALLRPHAPVQIVLGPGDLLPPNVSEDEVQRLQDEALVNRLHAASHVVANDSGPMHVAAMLRRHTVCVANHSSMREWLPPGVLLLAENAHKGHRATEVRPSDVTFDGWSSAHQVARAVGALL